MFDTAHMAGALAIFAILALAFLRKFFARVNVAIAK